LTPAARTFKGAILLCPGDQIPRALRGQTHAPFPFATELENFIVDSPIDVWIYGHSHTNIDTTIGHTKIVCNQMGYVFANEHLTNGFDFGKMIEI